MFFYSSYIDKHRTKEEDWDKDFETCTQDGVGREVRDDGQIATRPILKFNLEDDGNSLELVGG